MSYTSEAKTANPELYAERRRAQKRKAQARYKATVQGKQTEHKYKHNRRAQEYGADSESVTREGLRELHGDLCHWCRELMIFDNSGPRASWVSHEHLVSLSRGGANTWANSRLSHWACNTARGAREG